MYYSNNGNIRREKGVGTTSGAETEIKVQNMQIMLKRCTS